MTSAIMIWQNRKIIHEKGLDIREIKFWIPSLREPYDPWHACAKRWATHFWPTFAVVYFCFSADTRCDWLERSLVSLHPFQYCSNLILNRLHVRTTVERTELRYHKSCSILILTGLLVILCQPRLSAIIHLHERKPTLGPLGWIRGNTWRSLVIALIPHKHLY